MLLSLCYVFLSANCLPCVLILVNTDLSFPHTVSHFRLSPIPGYHVPRDGGLHIYREFVSLLPNIDPPELFGQHPNADITSQIQETRLLCYTLLSLAPQVSSGGSESTEDKVPVFSSVPEFGWGERQSLFLCARI